MYYSLCAWFDFQVIQESKLGSCCAVAAPRRSHGGRHFGPGDVTGVYRVKEIAERVCILTVLNVKVMWVGVDEDTYSRKSARPDFQGQGKPCFSCKGVGKMTFQDPGQRGGPAHGDWP